MVMIRNKMLILESILVEFLENITSLNINSYLFEILKLTINLLLI